MNRPAHRINRSLHHQSLIIEQSDMRIDREFFINRQSIQISQQLQSRLQVALLKDLRMTNGFCFACGEKLIRRSKSRWGKQGCQKRPSHIPREPIRSNVSTHSGPSRSSTKTYDSAPTETAHPPVRKWRMRIEPANKGHHVHNHPETPPPARYTWGRHCLKSSVP